MRFDTKHGSNPVVEQFPGDDRADGRGLSRASREELKQSYIEICSISNASSEGSSTNIFP